MFVITQVEASKLQVPNPKRHKKSYNGWSGFFPYYAGFPTSFSDAIISQLSQSSDLSLLDPWNGSGTSTFSATVLGVDAIGMDLNPVMAVVAKARLLPGSETPSLMPLAIEISERAFHLPHASKADDGLLEWFGPESAATIRRFERSIATHLVRDGIHENMSGISSIACALYVALFTAIRSFAKPLRTSNQTWTKRLRKDQKRLTVRHSALRERFVGIVQQMEISIADSAMHRFSTVPDILIGDTTQLHQLDRECNLVLTSPPYCTRLDYTSATAMELAVLQDLFPTVRESLSRKMLGSIKVPCSAPEPTDRWGPTALKFLDCVRDHPSKASATYYLKNHLDYFDKLDRSISSISASLANDALIFLVAQDSFYKEVHNDLPTIIVEMFSNRGIKLLRRDDFTSNRTMSGLNAFTEKYRKGARPTESVLCFAA